MRRVRQDYMQRVSADLGHTYAAILYVVSLGTCGISMENNRNYAITKFTNLNLLDRSCTM